MDAEKRKKNIRFAFFIIFIILFLYFIWLIMPILSPFILAFIIAYLLDPLVDWVEKKGINRSLAILILYVSFIGGISTALFYGLPKIIVELNKFAEAIPLYATEIQEYVSKVQRDYSQIDIPDGIRMVTDDTINQIENYLIQIVKSITESLVNFFGKIFDIILAPILAYYLLKDIDVFKQKILELIPASGRKELIELSSQIDKVLRSFLRGHLIVAFFVGTITALALSLVGMEFALILGITAGIFNIIPYFGPLIGIIPAVGLALLKSKKTALYVFGIMFFIQQVEGNIISPKILGKSIGLHPLMIIMVLLAGGNLFGLVGMILAVPITGVIKVLLNYVFKKIMNL